MRIRTCILILFVFTSVCSVGQGCQSGDCQPGVIAGPYTAAQTAQNTAANFPQCVGSLCTTAPWNGNQIEGIDAQENIGTAYQFYDQVLNLDTNIALGPTVTGENAQILQWVDGGSLQAFDKATGQAIYGDTGGTTAIPGNAINLWSPLTQPECSNPSGNVQVVYDRLDSVFAISRRVTYSVGAIDHYAWCIALSSGSDLSKTTWYAYEYKMDTAIPCLPSSDNCTTGAAYYYYPDWPRFATWSNGFYITFDLVNLTSLYQVGFEACQLDRADMVLGQPANPMTCYTYSVPESDEPSLIHSVDVGDIDSATGPPNGEPEYFLSIVNPSNAQQGNNGQGICTSQSTPCTSHQLALFVWGASGLAGPTLIPVNPYTPGCYDTAQPGSEINTICVPVPSTNPSDLGGYGSLLCGNYGPPCLDSLGDRMANRLTYNNLTSSGSGPNGAYLTASHVVMESASNERTGIRYYIFQVSNGAATLLVNSGGSSGPPDLQDPNATLFYFMPSAALDRNGNLAIVYTTSGAYCSNCQTQYNPAVNVDVLPWGASGFDSPTLIIQGTGDEENTMHWGEYAATVIDPTDNLTFYSVGEYFNTSQTGLSDCGSPSSDCYTWQTRIFQGHGPLPALVIHPLNLTFAQQTIGTTSPAQVVMLTNTGTATLTLSSIGITGANASDFAETNTCGPTVAPNDNCQVSVSFTPTAAGNRSAVLSITDNAPGSPQTASLTAMGQDFAVTPSGSAMATVTPGETANYTVAVTPGGGFDQTVVLTCSGAPPQSACSLSPSSVALQGSTPALVAVAVMTAGTSAGFANPAGFLPASGRLALWLAIYGLSGSVLLCSGGRSGKRLARWLRGLAFLCLLSLGITFSACGGGSGSMGNSGGATPAGSYNLTVTGTFTSGSTTVTHSTKLTLVVQ